ncbi:MAG: hypothetical protein OEZ34_05835, partial [Spirochaetia bacterium]|nr:hypothetical protein [Spirochaetia bacterium]
SLCFIALPLAPEPREDDYEWIDEPEIFKAMEKEIGEKLFPEIKKKGSEDENQNITKKNNFRFMKIRLCSGKILKGAGILPQKSILFKPEEWSIQKGYSIPSSVIRKIEIKDYVKLFSSMDQAVFMFPGRCLVSLTGGPVISGKCSWMEWLKITLYSSGKIQDLYTYYSKKSVKRNPKKLKKKQIKKYSEDLLICSIEFINSLKDEKNLKSVEPDPGESLNIFQVKTENRRVSSAKNTPSGLKNKKSTIKKIKK